MTTTFRRSQLGLALALGLLMSGCSNEQDPEVSTGNPAGAESTIPSSAVKPEEDAPPGAGAPPITSQRSSAAPKPPAPEPQPSNHGRRTDAGRLEQGPTEGPRCDLHVLASDINESNMVDSLVFTFCDGRWANVSQADTSVGNWLVRDPENDDSPWAWLEVDGAGDGNQVAQNCFKKETVEAHQPVPDYVRENIQICP